jgi:hypothetical protein
MLTYRGKREVASYDGNGNIPSVQIPNGGLADKGLAMGYNSPTHCQTLFAGGIQKISAWIVVRQDHRLSKISNGGLLAKLSDK